MTKEQFAAYVKVQKSGRTNMFHVSEIVRLSKHKLTREDCFDIMESYSEYVEKWPEVVEEVEEL